MNDYNPQLPSNIQPENLQKTANKIIYIVGGIGLAALIVAVVFLWIIPMTKQASGSDGDSNSGAGAKSSQQKQYEQCLKSGGSSTDCLKQLK